MMTAKPIVFSSLFGFIGLLLAFPCAAVECRYDTWRDFDWRYPKNEAKPSTSPKPLAAGNPIDLSNFSYYSSQLKQKVSLDQYAENNCVIALMLLKDGRVVYEKYFRGWKTSTPLYSGSVSKTLLSLISGIVIAEGKLSMTNKVVDIFPDYSESSYSQIGRAHV